MADLTILVALGEDSPASGHLFTVTTPASTYVSEWKELVYANVRSDPIANARNLTAWKVCLLSSLWLPDTDSHQLNQSIPVDDVDTTVATFGPALSAVAVKMLPGKRLSNYFSIAPSPKCLHVIVELPSGKSSVTEPDSCSYQICLISWRQA
jgi:hypothetical protein